MPAPTVVREAPRAPGAPIEVVRLPGTGAPAAAPDTVAVEEPLEIRLDGWRWLVTMRTPGDDADLVVGLLASEGAIATADEVASIVFTRHPEEPELANVADVHLARPLDALKERLARHQLLASSSCGLCGARAIEQIVGDRPPVAPGPRVEPALLAGLPATLADAQPVFRTTGGLHAAALFDAGGRLLAAREDIGRHNATDKVLGWRLRAGADAAAATILLVSGRASFEIVHKALVAGVPILAAVSAPSSLAIGLARAGAMTLVGFVRAGTLNCYTGIERLARPGADAEDDPLAFIPRPVRDALDAIGRTIGLADWRALDRADRARLVALAAPTGRDDFARALTARVTARTGQPPRPLPPRPARTP